jgi:hypothetical protein
VEQDGKSRLPFGDYKNLWSLVKSVGVNFGGKKYYRANSEYGLVVAI